MSNEDDDRLFAELGRKILSDARRCWWWMNEEPWTDGTYELSVETSGTTITSEERELVLRVLAESEEEDEGEEPLPVAVERPCPTCGQEVRSAVTTFRMNDDGTTRSAISILEPCGHEVSPGEADQIIGRNA